MYHLLKAAFSSYPTRLTGTILAISYEASTLYSRAFNRSYAPAKIPFNHISPKGLDRRALLSSVALTKSILVSFFSSAYWDASVQRVFLYDPEPLICNLFIFQRFEFKTINKFNRLLNHICMWSANAHDTQCAFKDRTCRKESNSSRLSHYATFFIV